MDIESTPDHSTAINEQTGTSPFLRLPSHLRQRIYTAAGVLGEGGLYRYFDLNYRPSRDYIQYNETIITHALLLTCRTTYEEVSTRVYSSHAFVIRFKTFRELEALRRLRPSVLRVMESLTIHLHVTSPFSCHYFTPPGFEAHVRWEGPGKPLQMSDVATQKILEEWHYTWDQYIRPHLPMPARLKLNFVCDVADVETGLVAIRPFLTGPQPLLAGCSVRLSYRADPELKELARRAVITSSTLRPETSDQSQTELPSSPFRFLNLPPEIRHQILSYTDLVTPGCEVEWNAFHGMYYRVKLRNRDSWDGYPPGGVYGICATALLPSGGEGEILQECESPHPKACFCGAWHAAHTNVIRCVCWAPPTPLFLVNHAMRQDALHIFFSRNRFVVAPTGGPNSTAVRSSPRRLAISAFLTSVVPMDGLQHLRFLEILFPPFGEDEPCRYCPRRSAEWYDWIRTLEKVKGRLNLPKLTIRAYFMPWQPRNPFKIPPYRYYMSTAQSDAIQKCYMEILGPLSRLKGLGRFFAHLANPTDWARQQSYDEMRMLTSLKSLEKEAEEMIMGEGYDSSIAGKADLTDSRWVDELVDYFTGRCHYGEQYYGVM